MASTRDELVFMAKVCEQTERFDDMLGYIKKLLEGHSQELNVEERNLLSVAYKNAVGTRRSAWRVLASIKTQEESKSDAHKKLLQEYRKTIEEELNKICNEIIGFLDTKLIPTSTGGASDAKTAASSQVFYMKMKGDYYRYISEYSGEGNSQVADKAFDAYSKAQEIATKSLEPADPIRLGLALNFSVFYYEVKNDPQKACELAKQAFDSAVDVIDKLDEDNYKDSTTILQLIRDNLTLWTSELADKNENA